MPLHPIETILMTTIGGFSLFMLTLLFINHFSARRWFCNKMGWHKTPKEQGFDGCSNTGICPRCNKEVLQSSQGDWF